MEEIALSFTAATILAVVLYFVSAIEVAVFSLIASDNTGISGSEYWLVKTLANPGDIETFFIVARGLILAGFALSFHLYFDYALSGSFFLRYIVEGILFGTIAILAMNILPASAVKWDAKRTLGIAPIIRMFYFLLYPLSRVSRVILDFILRHSGLEGIQSIATQRRLAFIADESGHNIEDDERKMIKQIMDFVETTVREVMVPRVDMVVASTDSSIDEVIELIDKKGHSRIPYYDDKVDNIIGILYAKDLLIAIGNNGSSEIDLSRICRKPYFIPESKLIDELLEEFRREKVHMAIVVDEYGGVAGLATLEDLLEEIVGEIQDEYDSEDEPIQQLAEGVWRVMGRIPIDEVSELLDTDLPEDEADTIGGLICHIAGAIPSNNFSVELENGVILTVEEVDGQRIKSVKVIRKPE